MIFKQTFKQSEKAEIEKAQRYSKLVLFKEKQDWQSWND